MPKKPCGGNVGTAAPARHGRPRSPHRARTLHKRGATNTRITHNSLGLDEIHRTGALDRHTCRTEFGFTPQQLAAYG
ncbi:hypothetical protein GCM10010211_85130 [Streptomyces albospinus]|uniref:Uncharacterized protein n=2 Tax=Streptomyces albospinus TaxID=285515 RepID=A0ABQ2VSS2_9ACTN|nr:hypothetical protein GCM10010211_85130 [Streptomyces albospinus]